MIEPTRCPCTGHDLVKLDNSIYACVERQGHHRAGQVHTVWSYGTYFASPVPISVTNRLAELLIAARKEGQAAELERLREREADWRKFARKVHQARRTLAALIEPVGVYDIAELARLVAAKVKPA